MCNMPRSISQHRRVGENVARSGTTAGVWRPIRSAPTISATGYPWPVIVESASPRTLPAGGRILSSERRIAWTASSRLPVVAWNAGEVPCQPEESVGKVAGCTKTPNGGLKGNARQTGQYGECTPLCRCYFRKEVLIFAMPCHKCRRESNARNRKRSAVTGEIPDFCREPGKLALDAPDASKRFPPLSAVAGQSARTLGKRVAQNARVLPGSPASRKAAGNSNHAPDARRRGLQRFPA